MQNLAHYLYCVHSFLLSGRMLKGLGTYGFNLASKVEVLALRLWP